MRAPNPCQTCQHLARLTNNTTKVRRTQANNHIRCTKYDRPALDAVGVCKRGE